MGNLLTDKYAEGYPEHRYYGGCVNIDAVENTAAREAEKLFGADYAYVQPHSGADTNLVAYWAILSAKIETPTLEELGVKSLNDLTDEQFDALRKKFGNQKPIKFTLVIYFFKLGNIASLIVALNTIILAFDVIDTILSISSLKPASNVISASSMTKYLDVYIFNALLSTAKSFILPGVPITI